MKTNKELMEWVDDEEGVGINGWVVRTANLKRLFKGMKLVPEGSIVLSLETANSLLWPPGGPYRDAERAQTALKEAIQSAEGAKKDGTS